MEVIPTGVTFLSITVSFLQRKQEFDLLCLNYRGFLKDVN